jgi:hypothetical protein
MFQLIARIFRDVWHWLTNRKSQEHKRKGSDFDRITREWRAMLTDTREELQTSRLRIDAMELQLADVKADLVDCTEKRIEQASIIAEQGLRLKVLESSHTRLCEEMEHERKLAMARIANANIERGIG